MPHNFSMAKFCQDKAKGNQFYQTMAEVAYFVEYDNSTLKYEAKLC